MIQNRCWNIYSWTVFWTGAIIISVSIIGYISLGILLSNVLWVYFGVGLGISIILCCLLIFTTCGSYCDIDYICYGKAKDIWNEPNVEVENGTLL